MADTESAGQDDPYSDASAKYGPLKLPALQPINVEKLYGGGSQVSHVCNVCSCWCDTVFTGGGPVVLVLDFRHGQNVDLLPTDTDRE